MWQLDPNNGSYLNFTIMPKDLIVRLIISYYFNFIGDFATFSK